MPESRRLDASYSVKKCKIGYGVTKESGFTRSSASKESAWCDQSLHKIAHEGQNCLVEAAQLIETTEERSSEVELHRLRGDMLNARGDQAAAEQNYRRALAVAKRQSAKTFGLRAATSLAHLWRDQGKCTEAHDLLALVCGSFTEGFGTPVLRNARDLLDQLA
jgi:predicted ATPase